MSPQGGMVGLMQQMGAPGQNGPPGGMMGPPTGMLPPAGTVTPNLPGGVMPSPADALHQMPGPTQTPVTQMGPSPGRNPGYIVQQDPRL